MTRAAAILAALALILAIRHARRRPELALEPEYGIQPADPRTTGLL